MKDSLSRWWVWIDMGLGYVIHFGWNNHSVDFKLNSNANLFKTMIDIINVILSDIFHEIFETYEKQQNIQCDF